MIPGNGIRLKEQRKGSEIRDAGSLRRMYEVYGNEIRTRDTNATC
jgi:hypothetical protein